MNGIQEVSGSIPLISTNTQTKPGSHAWFSISPRAGVKWVTKDIVAISAWSDAVGLKKDGTVVVAGDKHYNHDEVKTWKGIVSLDTGSLVIVGVQEDGTVLAFGNDMYGQTEVEKYENVQCVWSEHYLTVVLNRDHVLFTLGLGSVRERHSQPLAFVVTHRSQAKPECKKPASERTVFTAALLILK